MEPITTAPNLLNWPIFKMGNHDFLLGEVIVVVFLLFLLFLIGWFTFTIRNAKRIAVHQAATLEQSRETENQVAELIANQNELTGRMTAMNENMAIRQSDISNTVNERLEVMSGRIGESIVTTTQDTLKSLASLQERLAVIDVAQNHITDLAGQVVELQNILANKQTRGAFGEAQMQAIVADSLPTGAYQFQATLSTGVRPDCLIRMPNKLPALVIDSKFPLEAWLAIQNAESPEQLKAAEKKFQTNVETHVKTIAQKYLITGETQDTAFMFVPSESIFAEIHEKHDGIIQRARKAHVLIVSPSLLMLSIQVVQSLLKDAQMREQANQIRGEVIRLIDDVNRLDTRVRSLASHFGQTQKDLEQILISTDKISKQGQRINDLDFGSQNADSEV